jgi:DNA polymerase
LQGRSIKKELKEVLGEVKRYLSQQGDLFGGEMMMSGGGKIEDKTSGDVKKEFGVDPTWMNSKTLDELESKIHNCVKCPLGKTRTNFVFGVGDPSADIVFIGEAPGADEDLQGEPFVGRAGQLLNKMLASIGIRRSEVYICNVLKCRPPGNRNPSPSEISACSPYLIKQLEILKPKVIVSLGRYAAQTLLKTNASIGALRGMVHEWKGIKMIVTYHPAALLRNQQWKLPALEDLRKAKKIAGRK